MRLQIGTSRAVLGFAAVLAFVLAGEASAQPLKGTVEQHSFTGPVTGKTVLYNIYLPEGYSTSTARYPVVYHLHGIGGNQGGGQNTQVPQSFESALSSCAIGPVIVVFPNGYVDNFWADSIDGLEPAETNLVAELIPHVDANYRTIADRSNRVIEGFSMGGFGTMKFFAKFPELFTCAVEYDGALVTWADVIAFHAGVAAQVFGNSEAYFNIYSPWTWTTTNAATLSQATNIRMVVGALVNGNRRFRDFLTGLAIPRDYIETGCDHNLQCMLTAQGLNSATFIAARLKPFAAGASACRTGLAALSVSSSGKAPFTFQWQIEDGSAVGGWRSLDDGSLVLAGQPAATLTGTHGQTMNVSVSNYGQFPSTSRFRCIVTDSCASGKASTVAELRYCPSDANCDGFSDAVDYDQFMVAWLASDGASDVNADGFSDAIDYDLFVAEWLAGC